MGWLYPQYVIGQVFKGDKELDKLCKKSEGIIVKVVGKANGEVTYFMAWDGSKEGWETSNIYDDIREKFIERLLKIEAHWFKIDDDYEQGNTVNLTTYKSRKSKLVSPLGNF